MKPGVSFIDDTTRVLALLGSVRQAMNTDIDLAEKLANEALTLSRAKHFTNGSIGANLALGDISRVKGRLGEAERQILDAKAIAEDYGGPLDLAKCDLALFRLYFAKGNYDTAADFNARSLAIAEASSNKDLLADAYNNEGVMHGIRGKHITSIEYFLKSLEISRQLGDEAQVGTTLLRMGHTFELAGSYEKSLDYLFQALEVNQRLNHAANVGWCYLNIGVTYSRIDGDDHTRKLSYYLKALEKAEAAQELRLTLACLDNIGGSYSTRGDFKNANAFLMKAYNLSRRAGHNSRTVYITGNLAENFLYMGQLDSALLFGRENLRIAIQEKNTFEKRQAYSVLSGIYAARNENDKAYELLLNHTRLSDSLFDVQKSQQIEDLREKYEADKKEQAIGLLTTEKASAEFRRNSFAALSALFLLVGFLVFIVLRLRIKKNRLKLEKEIELDRMKSRFFANISHEFRSPLTLILGPIDDMLTRQENLAIRKHLRPMRKNASRLLELVNQLLELSRIEAGGLKPELSKNNIESLVKGLVMSFESLAEMKKIRLGVETGLLPSEIFIDRDKIEKILANLLSNAFKYTPENGVISVSVGITSNSRLPRVNKCLQINVKDSGSGIPPAELEHVFDRFYQADNNSTHQQEGSGIGLALTKELVELHCGVIWAESDEGGGTEMSLQLPLNLHETLAKYITEPLLERAEFKIDLALNDEVASDDGLRLEGTKKPVVLLVEDHADVRKYIIEVLQHDYFVLEASDGAEGVAVALDRIPDIIVSDVMMPKMTGGDVCVTLKKDERTSHIPIILLTAKADSASIIEGLETRADDYLTKPFVAKELLLRMHNLIESRKSLRKRYAGLLLTPSEVAVNSVDEQFLNRLMQMVEAHMTNDKFSVEDLGMLLGMSRSQLHRKLKALIGQGPNQFIRSFRLKRAHDLLKVNAATSSEVAYTVGFSSPSYFTKCFHEQFGYTPTEMPA